MTDESKENVCKCKTYPEGIDTEGCQIHGPEVYRLRREIQSQKDEVKRFDLWVKHLQVEIQKCGREIKFLKSTIKQLGEILEPLSAVESTGILTPLMFIKAKEAFSLPIVREILREHK